MIWVFLAVFIGWGATICLGVYLVKQSYANGLEAGAMAGIQEGKFQANQEGLALVEKTLGKRYYRKMMKELSKPVDKLHPRDTF